MKTWINLRQTWDKIYLWDLGDNDTIDAHFATDGDHDRLEINDNSTDLLGDSSSPSDSEQKTKFLLQFCMAIFIILI